MPSPQIRKFIKLSVWVLGNYSERRKKKRIFLYLILFNKKTKYNYNYLNFYYSNLKLTYIKDIFKFYSILISLVKHILILFYKYFLNHKFNFVIIIFLFFKISNIKNKNK